VDSSLRGSSESNLADIKETIKVGVVLVQVRILVTVEMVATKEATIDTQSLIFEGKAHQEVTVQITTIMIDQSKMETMIDLNKLKMRDPNQP
jgi:hypothetical protein